MNHPFAKSILDPGAVCAWAAAKAQDAAHSVRNRLLGKRSAMKNIGSSFRGPRRLARPRQHHIS
jgi:hypothetical protein